MTVQVLFFGATADIVGARCEQLETTDSGARQIIDRVIADHPQLARQKLLFSVNEEYVVGDTQLRDGDELAIFTAVSGG